MARIIDTRGKLCPQPIIMTRAAIKDCAEGENFEIIVDNNMACSNLLNYLAELSIYPTVQTEGNEQTLSFIYETKCPVTTEQKSHTDSIPTQNPITCLNTVLVIKSNQMGIGEEELGKLLIRSYLNTLNQDDSLLPSTIVAYNSGVYCAVEGTDTANTLKELEQKGVKIILCGTCLDYYELKDNIGAGQISNMFQIAETIAKADKVLYL